MVYHHLDKFDSHCGSIDIYLIGIVEVYIYNVLTFHVILQDHVTKESGDYIDRSHSR